MAHRRLRFGAKRRTAWWRGWGHFPNRSAPGLRLGWLTASKTIIKRITDGGLLDSGGGINHFTALVVSALCESGDYDASIINFCATYRERRNALIGALALALPKECSWYTPGGGFFAWVLLPDGIKSSELLPQAEAAGVSFIPGKKFHLNSGGEQALRLAFSYYPPEKLAEAGQILGEVLQTVTRF